MVEEEGDSAIALRSPADGVRDFVYGVSLVGHRVASFTPIRAGSAELRYEARTYFSSGNGGYDVLGMLRGQLISDVLAQFKRYLHLVHPPEFQLVHSAPEHQSGVSAQAEGGAARTRRSLSVAFCCKARRNGDIHAPFLFVWKEHD